MAKPKLVAARLFAETPKTVVLPMLPQIGPSRKRQMKGKRISI